MPAKKHSRCLKLDWAIYLHELENRLFSSASLQANELKPGQPLIEETQLQSLLAKTQHAHWATREQAAKDLAGVSHPDACHALIQLLKDESHGVCWAAMNSLISLRRAAVRPLLEELTRDFQSGCFLKAVRHVLSELHRYGELTGQEIRVLNSLTNNQKGLVVAQIANEALIHGALIAGVFSAA
jgi:hypothetical protein